MTRMPMALERIAIKEPQILAQSIVESLEDAIIFGDIAGGTQLTEETVCQMTGFSRSPVREALRLLEQDGLTERVPRRGFRVSRLTVKELDDLYICRISLEMTAVDLATKVASDAEIEGIRQAHLECERMLKSGDIRGHFNSNVEMSQRIFAAAHNRPLSRLVGSIHKQALRYRYAAYDQSEFIRVKSVENNTQFIEFLAARDGPRAADQVRKSIECSHGVIRNCLMQRVIDAGDSC